MSNDVAFARRLARLTPRTSPKPPITAQELALMLILEAQYGMSEDDREQLWGRPTPGLSMAEAQEAINQSIAVTSDLVALMVVRGWIVSGRSRRDHRVTLVMLSTQGLSLLKHRRKESGEEMAIQPHNHTVNDMDREIAELRKAVAKSLPLAHEEGNDEMKCLLNACEHYSEHRRSLGKPTSRVDGIAARLRNVMNGG